MSDRKLVIQKCRGGPEGDVIRFDLEPHTVGTDPRGRDITTCTVKWSGNAASEPARMSPNATASLEIITELAALATEDHLGRRCIVEANWRDEFEARRVTDSTVPKIRAQAFRRARDELKQARKVAISGGMAWLIASQASKASKCFNEANEAGAKASLASPPL